MESYTEKGESGSRVYSLLFKITGKSNSGEGGVFYLHVCLGTICMQYPWRPTEGMVECSDTQLGKREASGRAAGIGDFMLRGTERSDMITLVLGKTCCDCSMGSGLWAAELQRKHCRNASVGEASKAKGYRRALSQAIPHRCRRQNESSVKRKQHRPSRQGEDHGQQEAWIP